MLLSNRCSSAGAEPLLRPGTRIQHRVRRVAQRSASGPSAVGVPVLLLRRSARPLSAALYSGCRHGSGVVGDLPKPGKANDDSSSAPPTTAMTATLRGTSSARRPRPGARRSREGKPVRGHIDSPAPRAGRRSRLAVGVACFAPSRNNRVTMLPLVPAARISPSDAAALPWRFAPCRSSKAPTRRPSNGSTTSPDDGGGCRIRHRDHPDRPLPAESSIDSRPADALDAGTPRPVTYCGARRRTGLEVERRVLWVDDRDGGMSIPPESNVAPKPWRSYPGHRRRPTIQRGTGISLERHLLEDRFGDVVVAAPVRGSFGERELVQGRNHRVDWASSAATEYTGGWVVDAGGGGHLPAR